MNEFEWGCDATSRDLIVNSDTRCACLHAFKCSCTPPYRTQAVAVEVLFFDREQHGKIVRGK
jgi:hypothetical protein